MAGAAASRAPPVRPVRGTSQTGADMDILVFMVMAMLGLVLLVVV
jgi:hypothetical protein